MKSVTCPRCFTIISMTWLVQLPSGLCLYCAFDLSRYYQALLKTRETYYEEIHEYLDAQIRELFGLR